VDTASFAGKSASRGCGERGLPINVTIVTLMGIETADWIILIASEFQGFERRDEIKNRRRIPKDPPFAKKERLTNRLSFSDERAKQPIPPILVPREKPRRVRES
jgi:hypothetical protein